MRLLMRFASGLLGLSMVLTIPALADDIFNWSDTDASNNRAAPNGWQSGVMLPSQVEPTGRAMMGAIHRNTNTWDGRQFGTSTGASDNSSAINTCLTTAGKGGTCVISQTLAITGNVTIPADTTLTCGFTFGDEEDTPANFGTAAALKLSSSATISAGGSNATIRNCLIYRNGMTFPAADSTGYAGTALSDAGKANFTVENTTIVGFDRCISLSGQRPYIIRVHTDCAGVTNPAIDVENGNTDSGYFDKIKLQPLGTGNYNGSSVLCAAATRAGTGFKMNGINYVGAITSQNFRTSDIEIDAYTHADILWSDFVSACATTYSSSVGIKNTSQLAASELNINSSGVGMVQSGLLNAQHVFLNSVWGDCIQMPTAAARTSIGYLETNDGSGGNNCGKSGSGYAINYTDSAHTSSIQISRLSIKAVATTPYINIPSAVNATNINITEDGITDLANPSTLYGTTSVGSLSGAGSGATISLVTSSRTTPWKGSALISTGTSATGTITFNLTFPLTAPNTGGCIFMPQAGAINWPTLLIGEAAGVSSTVQQSQMFLSGAPTSSTSNALRMNFECNPQ